jgi:tetrahydromethanopterin S-methyltransferase subunit G
VADSPISNGADTDSSGIEQITLKDVDEAFKAIPGIPTLAEFAAGANRTAAGFLDFLGPDNINAVLELAGSNKQIPTFTQAITEKTGAFDPSLVGKAAAAAGELTPAALGIGQALRSMAQKLPQIAAGETAGRGVVRQLGETTARQDVVGATAAGIGQEVGREVGGETGALVGGIAAPLVAGIPLTSARGQARKLLKKSAPEIDDLKAKARGIYKSLDESGVTIPAKQFDTLADDVARTLRKEGSDVDLTPKAIAVINRLQSEKGFEKSLTEIDTLRKVARNAADSADKAEARLGNIAIEKIDNFLDGIGGQVTQGKEAGEAFKSARNLWQRARKAEDLQQAIKVAENQASGFENGIRIQFRQILNKIDKGKLKGYTQEERDAIKRVVEGTKSGNVARFFGKFGILDGLTSRSLTTMGGMGLAGAATGSGIAATAVPLFGQMSGALAQRMTLNNAKMASALVRAGKNANTITNIYTRNTPAAQRSATELAELFIKNKVPMNSINLRRAKPLMSDAAVIASVARLNDEKEAKQ